jgi:hypothetical protein
VRITGNRIGLALMPFLAGLLAAITGVAGIFLLSAFSLAASAMAVRQSRQNA